MAAPNASSAPLKGNLLWVRSFQTIEELRLALIDAAIKSETAGLERMLQEIAR